MSVLVTGANGLLGNNLCRKLLAAGHEVRAFVRKTEISMDSKIYRFSFITATYVILSHYVKQPLDGRLSITQPQSFCIGAILEMK